MTDWTPPPWTVGDRIRKARETAGLSQTALGLAVGIGKNTISNYENGTTEPSRPNLEAICRATGVPSSWILDE